MHEEAFGLDGVVCVVGVHAFVVIREYGVVDGEFCEHGMIHDVSDKRTSARLFCQRGQHPMERSRYLSDLGLATTRFFMKTKTKTKKTPPKLRISVSREDRARTNAGKTVNSKVRSEGRTLAAMERATLTQTTYKAEEAKKARLGVSLQSVAPCGWGIPLHGAVEYSACSMRGGPIAGEKYAGINPP